MKTTFRDENSEVIFERGDVGCKNCKHLPVVMIHKWPLVKFIITSTMDDGFPVRTVEVKRTKSSNDIVKEEEENHLHSQRNRKEPRKKVTVVRRKNELNQM